MPAGKWNAFYIIVLVLALIVPAGILSMYPGFTKSPPQLYSYLSDELALRLDLSAIQMAMEMDPNYNPLTIDENLPEDIQKEIRDDFMYYLDMMTWEILSSPDLHYRASMDELLNASNWDTMVDLSDDDAILYWYTFRTDNSGKATIDGSNTTVSAANLERILKDYYYSYEYGAEDTDIDTENLSPSAYYDDQTGTVVFGNFNDLAKINLPKNMEMKFYITPQLTYNSAISFYFQRGDTVDLFSEIWMAILAGLCALFVLLWPYRQEKQAVVFSSICHLKLLPAAAFFLLADAGIVSLILFSTYSVVSGNMVYNLQRAHIPMALFLTYGSSYLCWGIFIYLACLSTFYLKHIFAGGFVRFLKEDTLMASLFSWIKGHFSTIHVQDLSKGYGKVLLKLLLFNFTGILLIAFTAWVIPESFFPAFLLALLYSILCFYFASRELKKVQKDFKTTLDAAGRLADGDFHSIREQKVGLLQPIYTTLLKIRPGFEKAVEEAMASQNLKTELISNVSHDLKTPLTGIKNYVELIDQAGSLEETKEYAAKLNSYSDRLDRLIVDLFDVSKANSGTIELEKMEVCLQEMIEQIQMEHEEEWKKKRLQTVFKFPEERILLQLDPNKTARIFENLITNITKYALDNTRVFIEIVRMPDQVMILYKNLSRFPLDFDSRKITDRFVRGDASRHEAGSGLGLAIATSFTQIQNGIFRIETDGDLFKAILIFPLQENRLPDHPQ